MLESRRAGYKPAEIAALWSALKSCYGSDAAARLAVEQNNQVLCPVYASPALLQQSYKALVGIFGKDEALKIMAMNPAVLTCGAPGLQASEPSEIRKAAETRQVLDRVVTPAGFAVAILVVLALNVAFRVANL